MLYPQNVPWQKYDPNNDTLIVHHDHGAYIRGWCMLLDGVDRGYYINDNPYSKHYNYSRHKSWEAGRDDAWKYLNT